MIPTDASEKRKMKRAERLKGLQALLETYYNLGLHTPYTKELSRKVSAAKTKQQEGL